MTARRGDGGKIVRVDPDTSKVVAGVDVSGPFPPYRLADGDGAVWATTGGEGRGTVMRIDPGTNSVVSSIPLEGGPQELTVGRGALWVQTLLPLDEGKIVRIDPATNGVAGTIRLSGQASDVAASYDGVWSLAGGGPEGQVVKIDPLTNRVVGALGLRNPGFLTRIAAGEDAVWVASPGGSVWRIDPETIETVSEAIQVESGIVAIGVGGGGGGAWVLTGMGTVVARIDGATNRVVAKIPVRGGGSPHGLAPGVAVGYGAVWVTGQTALIRIAL